MFIYIKGMHSMILCTFYQYVCIHVCVHVNTCRLLLNIMHYCIYYL